MMLGNPARLTELADLARRAGTPERLTVLEWGSGESTVVLLDEVNRRKNGQLVTIDHNHVFQEEVLSSILGKPRLAALTADLIGSYDPASQDLNYSTTPLKLTSPWDLILIDGRRRLECSLVASLIASPDTIIVLHDYRRARYSPIPTIFGEVQDQPEYRVMKIRKDRR